MKTLKWTLLITLTLHVYTIGASSQDEELENYFRRKMNDFKIKLHEGFERARLQRSKRSVIAPNNPDYGVPPQDHMRVVGTKPVDLGIQFGNVSCWEPINFAGTTMLLVATLSGRVELLRWAGGRYTAFAGMSTSLATSKVKAFVYGDQLWLACLHQRRAPNEQFVRLYQLQGQQLVTKQSIELGGESDIDLVRGATAHYLVTCVFRSFSNSGTSYHGKLV